jgi:hypothetical protein
MKITLDKQYELKLTADAVEKIEENYDKSLDEICSGKMRSKDVTFMVWACMDGDIELETAKKLFSKHSTYTELVTTLVKLLGSDPNEQGAEKATENELSSALPVTE